MFKVPDGGKIEVQDSMSSGRVWLDLPLHLDSHASLNLLEVNVRLEDLERAIAEYKALVKAHA